jgi:hypothetical protein
VSPGLHTQGSVGGGDFGNNIAPITTSCVIIAHHDQLSHMTKLQNKGGVACLSDLSVMCFAVNMCQVHDTAGGGAAAQSC